MAMTISPRVAGVIERESGQPRRDAATLECRQDFGVDQRDAATLDDVVQDTRERAIKLGLEPLPFRGISDERGSCRRAARRRAGPPLTKPLIA